MKHFDKLHSYTEPHIFLSWISKDRKFIIQKEVTGFYGLLYNSNDFSEEGTIKYHAIRWEDKRNISLRKCYKLYLKLINEL